MTINCWIYIVFLAILKVKSNRSEQVTILDTTKTESLGWVTYSAEDDVTGRRGWKEASYTNADGDVFRIYTVCNVANAEVDNWLRTPYVPRNDANRLHIEVKFTMRKCTKYPDPGRLQQCKESFKLLYYEAESDFANAMMPTWDGATYRHVDVIAADRVFSDVNDAVINTETRSVPVTRRGLYFAFQDVGACTTILAIRVYYVVCPSVVVNYAVFPRTTAGLELTSIVQSDGSCVEHSAIEQQPSYLCQADGNWYYPTGGCQCMPGYQPGLNRVSTECLACPVQMYKWSTSSELCLPCPGNSEATSPASVQCACLSGYYRAKDDSKRQPCTGPPSDIQNLTIAFLDQSMVSLNWLPPLETGGRTDLRYRVECNQCDDGAVFLPGQMGFNSTNITILGLSPLRQYTINVFAENGVSASSRVLRQTSITIRTSAPVPLKVGNVRVTGVGTDYASLIWDQGRGLSVETYEVRYWSMDGRQNTTSVFSISTNFTLVNLVQQTKYMIMVRGKTEKGWGEFSEAVYAVTGHVFQYPTESPVAIIAGSFVAIFVCLVIGLIMMTVFIKRSRRSYNEKAASHSDCTAGYNNPAPQLMDNVIVSSLSAPAAAPVIPTGVRTYVDPHTYEDPNEAVKEFTKEIDLSYVIIESVIGGGEFGDVCKGMLRIPGKLDLSVAIKTLKPGASEKSCRDFLTEASIMGQFDDPNVIYLEGVVTRTTPIMILTEYMANGSLDKFLKANDGKLTVLQLVGMMRGIASGMRYLSDMGFIHRDLAARNILVSETLICKVADFGLSREVETDNSSGIYTTKGGKIPVRWTAPEAIAYRKFTSASDVWSYGVVMWEVMSFGEWPYWNWSNQDVIRAIDADYRLPPPMDCPETVYQLMQDCWQKERGHRPRFASVVRSLDKLIRSPELLRRAITQSGSCNSSSVQLTANARPGPSKADGATSSTLDGTACSVVDKWLTGIKMDRYCKVFREAGYRTMPDVAQMRPSDLARLGITLAGHQKKILSAVHALQTSSKQFSQADASFV